MHQIWLYCEYENFLRQLNSLNPSPVTHLHRASLISFPLSTFQCLDKDQLGGWENHSDQRQFQNAHKNQFLMFIISSMFQVHFF